MTAFSKLFPLLPLLPLCSVLVGCGGGQTLTTKGPAEAGKTVAGLPYFLPRAYVPITLKGGPTPKDKDGNPTSAASYQIDVTPGAVTYIADSGAPLFLAYDHSSWGSDHFVLAVDQNGLLQTTSTSANDQSGAVALKVIEIVGEIAQAVGTFGAGGGNPFHALRAPPRPAAATIRCTLPPFTTTVAFFPGADETRTFGVGKQQVTISMTTVADPGTAGPGGLSVPGISDSPSPKNPIGVAFRRPTVKQFKIEVVPTDEAAMNCGLASQSATSFVSVPDTSQAGIFWQDVSRASLVKKDVKLSIANGMLTGVEVDNPSEILAAVSLTSDVLKAILSIPASVLSFKVQQINAAESIPEAQAKEYQAMVDLLQKQAAILQTKLGNTQ